MRAIHNEDTHLEVIDGAREFTRSFRFPIQFSLPLSSPFPARVASFDRSVRSASVLSLDH
ncbi:hypothetical protein BRC68_08170 [Halobacteriales archaeon QH_6_64_20]|nr:MAG: hypothetical protein BRC68_08170 [Halobacteriales archaeon QH_6_64_20]